jgi:hypothetical protein
MVGSLSSMISRLHAEGGAFSAFREESAARDQMLRMSQEAVVTTRKHFWKPSILMNPNGDVNQSTGCIALYYGKSKIIPAEAVSP